MVAPEVLEGFPFFAGLAEGELRDLATIAELVSWQRGDLIFCEGDPAAALYLLVEGWVDILIKTDAHGARQALMITQTAGDIFGWSAVVAPYVYTASAVCVSPVQSLRFGGDDLLALFEREMRLCCIVMQRINQVIADRLQATRLQMVSLLMAH
jgi:CRP-like cAMP-binding protein